MRHQFHDSWCIFSLSVLCVCIKETRNSIQERRREGGRGKEVVVRLNKYFSKLIFSAFEDTEFVVGFGSEGEQGETRGSRGDKMPWRRGEARTTEEDGDIILVRHM